MIKALEEIKIMLHPNTLFLQTHLCVSILIPQWVFEIWTIKIFFGWVPTASHTGIGSNEKADSAAKSALWLPHAKVGVPYTYFKILYQAV